MPWSKTPNVAMFKGANWDTYVKTVPNCSPEQACRIARLDPEINFFFFCRGYMVLENPAWPAPREFNPGDAVFFSGEPWYGSAPQCDSYQKDGISVAYIGGASAITLAQAGCYTTSDGSAAVDVVCIFAANINQTLVGDAVALAPQVPVPSGGSIACGNPNILQALQSGAIGALQAKGITVLLTFLNNHDASGWSEFSSETDAANFVQQLQNIVANYGLDGIDIDDEYSAGTPISSSLAMVTSLMQTAMPEKIISKALFDDIQYFGIPYDGVTLEQTLTYGWEMSYGGDPKYRLSQYVEAGMHRDALALGFWSGQASPNPATDVAWLKDNHYAGVMVYAFEEASNATLLGTLVDDWCGSGNWNKTPNCP